MCIVVDPPVFIPLFKSRDPENRKFAPVLNWLSRGPGKLVLGGTTYEKELRQVSTILGFLAELERSGKIVRVPQGAVDLEQRMVRAIEPRPEFDDAHLVALVRASGCKLVCTRDKRAGPFIRSARFYRAGMRPKIYTSLRHRKLLCSRNIAGCCQ